MEPLSAAERILKSLAIETPEEIDLEVIAWRMGVAGIRYRRLDGCEAPIVGRRGRAIVSVREGVRPARQRFSICHRTGPLASSPRAGVLYCQILPISVKKPKMSARPRKRWRTASRRPVAAALPADVHRQRHEEHRD